MQKDSTSIIYFPYKYTHQKSIIETKFENVIDQGFLYSLKLSGNLLKIKSKNPRFSRSSITLS